MLLEQRSVRFTGSVLCEVLKVTAGAGSAVVTVVSGDRMRERLEACCCVITNLFEQTGRCRRWHKLKECSGRC